MSRWIWVAIAALLFVTGGAAVWLVRKNQAATTQDSVMGENTTPAELQKTGTFKELLSLTGSQQCTYSSVTETGASEGSVYVFNGQIRADSLTAFEDQAIKSHALIRDQTVYVWMDGQNTGIKMALNAITTPAPTGTSQNQIDWEQQVDYNCSIWAPETAKFELPADVTFQDLGAFMPAVSPAAGTGAPAVNCAVCDNLSGEAKTQCLAALSCQ